MVFISGSLCYLPICCGNLKFGCTTVEAWEVNGFQIIVATGKELTLANSQDDDKLTSRWATFFALSFLRFLGEQCTLSN